MVLPLHVRVVVPARDEEELLPACLASLCVAAERVRTERGVSVGILVVLDRCTDGSAGVVAGAGWVRALAVDHGNVGAARRAGVDAVLEGLADVDDRRVLLATTDADSRVPAGWLVGLVDLVEDGADLVVGTVTVDDWAGHDPSTRERWGTAYGAADPHPHVHGANLALTGRAYRTIGGFPPVVVGEDVALVAASAALRVVRSRALPVRTSARLRGRVEGGFADHLRSLAEADLDDEAV